MFDLYFVNAIIAYSKYYNDINDYSRLKNELCRIDCRKELITDLFAKFNIYNEKIIHYLILYFHQVRLYFI
jgi:hypothetical protein